MPTNYRAAVGPEENYDILGAHQFMLLVMLGLREMHKLLDIGCGSLRAGRFFISYLNPGNYYGLEPDEYLIKQGMLNELGEGIHKVKQPKFLVNSDFYMCWHNDDAKCTRYDYVLAQSVFSHTPPMLLKKCLKNLNEFVIHKSTCFAFTYFSGSNTHEHATEWIGRDNGGIVRYHWVTFRSILNEHGWFLEEIPWQHPSGQTWCVAARNGNRLTELMRRLKRWSGQIYRS